LSRDWNKNLIASVDKLNDEWLDKLLLW
jgi:hypothetical protein